MNATTSVFIGYDQFTLEKVTTKLPLAKCEQAVICFDPDNLNTVITECESAQPVNDDNGGNCCQKCRSPKTGQNIQYSDNEIYVNACVDISLCDFSFNFKAVGKQASTVTDLNCNKCEDVEGEKTLLIYSLHGEEMKERCDFKFIENCQIAQEDDAKNLECLICEPGYKLDAKKRCVTFNCLSTTVPNSCEICEENYILSIDAKNCIENTSTLFYGKDIDPRCKKADTIKTNNCMECHEGYTINGDKKCDDIRISNCHHYSKKACTRCDEGYSLLAISNTNTFYQCTAVTTYPIWRCELYGENNECRKCEDGYALDLNEKNCFKDQFCSKYDSNANKCIICGAGYYLNSEKICIPGNIKNCKYYTSSNECGECETGFQRVRLDAFHVVCGEGITIENCTESSLDNNLKLQCDQCAVGYKWEEEEIRHCVPYQLGSELCLEIDSFSYICKKCADSHYFSGNSCKERKNMYVNCAVKSADSDICEECNTGFVLEIRTNECIAATRKHNNCISYQTSGICQECSPGYYPAADGGCVYLGHDFVHFCASYDENRQCTECKFGFDLENNNCVMHSNFNELVLTACIGFDDDMNCSTCIDGYLLSEHGCMRIEKNKITFCKFYDNFGNCSQCIDNYYLDIITGECRLFSREDFLKQVIGDYGVANIGDVMIDCRNITYDVPNSACELCKSGYYTIDGKCVKCTFKIENCNICQEDKCMVCSSGYYMTINGECEKSWAGITSVFGLIFLLLLIN